MKNYKKINLTIVSIACVLALFLVLLPLLIISQYNYPSADDWSYSVAGYRTLTNGGGIFSVIASAVETSKTSYMNWEGRFANHSWQLCSPACGEKNIMA